MDFPNADYHAAYVGACSHNRIEITGTPAWDEYLEWKDSADYECEQTREIEGDPLPEEEEEEEDEWDD